MRKGWDKRKLGDISELVTKGTTPTSVGFDFVTSGINFVKVESISSTGEFIQDKFAHITWNCHESLKRSQLEPGDILFSIAGALGRTAIVTSNIIPANTNQALAIIRLKKGIGVFDRFVLAALQAGSIFEQIEKFKGGVAQLNLSLAQVRDLLIPLPPLDEQQRIVSILDEAFAGLASAQAHAARNLQNARALFESHLQAVFTQRGEGWIEKPLKVLTELITKGSSPRWQGISYVEKPGVLFITSENVGENQILLNAPKYVEDKFNEKDKKSILRRGDVLTNIVGASIGRTAVYDRDEVANINQAVCLIRCMPDFLLNRFLAYYFNSPLLKDILHAGEVNMARANLSLGFFAELPVAFPSIARQSAIVEHLDALSSETQHLTRIYEQKLAALAALKKSLLHQAFSGEL